MNFLTRWYYINTKRGRKAYYKKLISYVIKHDIRNQRGYLCGFEYKGVYVSDLPELEKNRKSDCLLFIVRERFRRSPDRTMDTWSFSGWFESNARRVNFINELIELI